MYCFLYPFFCFFLLRFSYTFFQNFLNLIFCILLFSSFVCTAVFCFLSFCLLSLCFLSFVLCLLSLCFFVFCSLSFVPRFALHLLSFAHFCSYIRTVFFITNIRSHILLYLAKNVNPQINIFYRKILPGRLPFALLQNTELTIVQFNVIFKPILSCFARLF